jgi:hypothetical protein
VKPAAPDEKVKELIARYKKVSIRKNGVLLKATFEVKDANLAIHWALDYGGPRPPLTILRPSMEPMYLGLCYLVIIAIDETGEAHSIGVHPAGFTNPWAFPKNAFVTVSKNEIAKGTFDITQGQRAL